MARERTAPTVSQPARALTLGGADRRAVIGAALADTVAIAVFVVLGRRSHEQAGTIAGFLGTATPFWLGAVAGWVASRAWRRPAALLPVGVAVWVGAVVLGLLLRRTVFGDGTAASFVVVTTLFLGVTLLGWRLAAKLAGKRTFRGETVHA